MALMTYMRNTKMHDPSFAASTSSHKPVTDRHTVTITVNALRVRKTEMEVLKACNKMGM